MVVGMSLKIHAFVAEEVGSREREKSVFETV